MADDVPMMEPTTPVTEEEKQALIKKMMEASRSPGPTANSYRQLLDDTIGETLDYLSPGANPVMKGLDSFFRSFGDTFYPLEARDRYKRHLQELSENPDKFDEFLKAARQQGITK